MHTHSPLRLNGAIAPRAGRRREETILDTLQYALRAILPLILEIALGCFLRRIGFLDAAFFQKGRRLVYYTALPASIFYGIYTTQTIREINPGLLVFCFLMVLMLFGIGTLMAVTLFPDHRKRGVVIQSAYRSNFSIIAISLSEALGGSGALSAAAVLSATTIPEFNVLAVLSMTMFVHPEGGKSPLRQSLRGIVTNPLIIGSLTGLGCLLVRQALPCDADGNAVFLLSEKLPWLFSFIRALGQMSTPLALICLGGLFDFSKLRGAGRDILIGCALRVLIAPAVSLGAAIALNASGLMHFSTAEFACMVSVFASPLATVTGVMAAQMGSDDVYGDQLVVLTTLIGAFTLFITVCVMRANGFL